MPSISVRSVFKTMSFFFRDRSSQTDWASWQYAAFVCAELVFLVLPRVLAGHDNFLFEKVVLLIFIFWVFLHLFGGLHSASLAGCALYQLVAKSRLPFFGWHVKYIVLTRPIRPKLCQHWRNRWFKNSHPHPRITLPLSLPTMQKRAMGFDMWAMVKGAMGRATKGGHSAAMKC